MTKLRKWYQRRKLISRIEWDLVHLQFGYMQQPHPIQSDAYLERRHTLHNRLCRLEQRRKCRTSS
jgi:hypothetical protein